MPRRGAISILLLAVLTVSSSACGAGWTGAESSCRNGGTRSNAIARAGQGVTVAAAGCGAELKRKPGRCGIRGFDQTQFVSTVTASGAPRFFIAVHVPAPSYRVPNVSSIGSPETDRGPPRS